jgi:hypothetical protein
VYFFTSFTPSFIPSLFVFRKVFHPGNHAVFLKQTQETKDGSWAPIPKVGQSSDTRAELAAPKSCTRIVNADCQGVRQIEPGLQPGESPSFFPEDRIRPGLSPEKRIASIHSVFLDTGLKTNGWWHMKTGAGGYRIPFVSVLKMGLNCAEFSADFLRIAKLDRRNIAEFARQNGLFCLFV